MERLKAIFNWSGGKDSAHALLRAMQSGRIPLVGSHPAGLNSKNESMKKQQNKGGRPAVSIGRIRKYIVSTRLDPEHNLKLGMLVRKSGQRPAEVIRQLIAYG